MIIILKENPNTEELANLKNMIEGVGVSIKTVEGKHKNILGLIGDTSVIDIETIKAYDIVENVQRIQDPFKAANRKFHPENTIVKVDDLTIGGNKVQIIAGPCSVENEDQIIETAIAVKAAGATMLRGGAFKPRTSPYAFQGLHADGIELLLKTKKATGLPIVTEIMSMGHLDIFSDVDIIQVGARNMQNFTLLKALGNTKKAILLKRGMSATVKDLLMAAEYIIASGNPNVILCERGIRTFETYTRNTVDINIIPSSIELSHLPIIIDASHGTGKRSLVAPITLAGLVAGAHGAMVEVHPCPECALSDGPQSLRFGEFGDLMKKVRKYLEFEERVMG